MTINLREVLVAGVIILGSVISSLAQSEKEIVARYTQALQKSADESALKSLVARGDIDVQKLRFPAAIYYKLPNCMRIEMTFQALTFLQVSNDSLKWEYDPFKDQNSITRVDNNDKNPWPSENSSFDFINPDLINYKALNNKLKLIRIEKLDSVQVQVLELSKSKKDGSKSMLYLNNRDGLIYKVEDEKGYRYFTDYRSVDGFMFPTHVIDSNEKQLIEMTFTELTFNKPIPDSVFLIPEDAFTRHEEAQTEFQRLLAAGDRSYQNGHYDSAEIWYSKAIKESNRHYGAYNSRGLARIGQKRYYEAVADFNNALEIQPEGSKAYNNRGLSKYYLGDYKGALEDYNRAIALEPTFKIALKNRGTAYIQAKDYESAVLDFSAAIKLDKHDGEAHYKYAIALAQLERYEEALTSYHRAIKNQIQVADIYNYMGVSEYKLDRYDSAAAHFKIAVTLDGTNLQYLENYGRALYELGNYGAAVDQFRSYLSKKNEAPEIYNLIGLCKYQEENYKGAIKDFTKSIELNGSVATYYDNRAAAKEMIEDYVGTIEDYSSSIRIYPNDPRIFYKRGLVKILTSKKIEGCLDLATANEMEYEPAKQAILENCN